jgi:hypothetical protein
MRKGWAGASRLKDGCSISATWMPAGFLFPQMTTTPTHANAGRHSPGGVEKKEDDTWFACSPGIGTLADHARFFESLQQGKLPS